MEVTTRSAHDLIGEIRKPTGKPGGGALLTYTAAFGLNLVLMMDRPKSPDHRQEMDSAREKILEITEELEKIAVKDMQAVENLVESFKSGENFQKASFLAAIPPKKTISLIKDGLKATIPLIKYGKIDALSDGEIGVRLAKECMDLCIINIRLNMGGEADSQSLDLLREGKENFLRNIEVIEERKKWPKK